MAIGSTQSAFGIKGALETNTTGETNVAISTGALGLNTTGSYNVAIGYRSLNSNTTASNNTAVGYQAGYSNTTGQYNTFIGKTAGEVSTSDFNTYIGHDAGLLMTSGQKNTILGRYNGNQGGLDIRTSSNNIVLSDGDGNPRLILLTLMDAVCLTQLVLSSSIASGVNKCTGRHCRISTVGIRINQAACIWRETGAWHLR